MLVQAPTTVLHGTLAEGINISLLITVTFA